MMIKRTLIALTCFISLNGTAQNMHHEITANVNITDQSIYVVDNILLKEAYFLELDTLYFYLNSGFTIETQEFSFTKQIAVEVEDKDGRKKYAIKIKRNIKGDQTMLFKIGGKVDEEIKDDVIAQARGFSSTSGIISEKGVYMAGSTVWIPTIEEVLFTYNLEVDIDNEWSVVSQGTRTKNVEKAGRRTIRYESPDLMDEVHLIAAKFTEYNLKSEHVLFQAFLRTPDKELADRYLSATKEYLELYESLIGRYPYTKFALVENFWETGYGMPSFTLLGERVIRFPFILHSSYPHELLHNWWGNSVYVDYEGGNWCEGLTAYMADHLIKEQQGLGGKYRREALEKFTNYVNDENDFPFNEFISRNSPAEEAIGYGKVMMFNDMLRLEVGDDIFLKAYSKFYEENKFTHASFDDIRVAFENFTEKDLKPFFKQWSTRKGAPTLVLSDVKAKKQARNYELSFDIKQIQEEYPFELNIPIAIYLENNDDVIFKTISMSQKQETYKLYSETRPLRIDIDPQTNVFRRLDQNEVPPILSQLFGSVEGSIILPKGSPLFDAYSRLAREWQAVQQEQHKILTILIDSNVTELPTGPCWIIGNENKFAKDFVKDMYSDYLSDEILAKVKLSADTGSLVYTFLNSENNNQITGFISSTQAEAIAALTRKLPHYGKYSYLGFEGAEAKNTLKGEFPALNSPLSWVIDYEDKPVISSKLMEREALKKK